MFSKLLLILALSLTSAQVFSQDSKDASKKEEKPTDLSNQNFAYTMYDYLKKKFTVSYHGEYYATRGDILSPNEEDHEIQDLRIMHIPSVTYRPFENWKLSASSEFKYTDATYRPLSFAAKRHFRSLVSLTREKLMTEKEHGFGLSAGVARRIFDRVSAPTNYGNSRANVNLTKTWMGKHPSSLLVQYLANDPSKGSISPDTWKHGFNLLPTITFQLTDKLSYLFNDDFIVYTSWQKGADRDYTIAHDMNVAYITYAHNDKNSSYFQLKYIHLEGFGTVHDTYDSYDYYIGHTYSFTPKLSITPEIGSTLFRGADGKDFLAENVKYPEFAIYLDWAL